MTHTISTKSHAIAMTLIIEALDKAEAELVEAQKADNRDERERLVDRVLTLKEAWGEFLAS